MGCYFNQIDQSNKVPFIANVPISLKDYLALIEGFDVPRKGVARNGGSAKKQNSNQQISSMKILVFILIVTTFSGKAMGNAYDSLKDDSKRKVSPELELYQKLYENEKNANEKLLSFIYTSLEGGAAILLFIIGSQIFFNYKINSAEVDSIKNDLKKSFMEFKGDVEKENEKLYKKIEGETKTAFEAELELVASTVDKNLKDLNSKIDEKMLDVSYDLNTTIGDLHSKTDQNGYISVHYYIRAANSGMKAKYDILYILENLIHQLKVMTDVEEDNHNELLVLVKEIASSYPKEKEILQELANSIGIYRWDRSKQKAIEIRKNANETGD